MRTAPHQQVSADVSRRSLRGIERFPGVLVLSHSTSEQCLHTCLGLLRIRVRTIWVSTHLHPAKWQSFTHEDQECSASPLNRGRKAGPLRKVCRSEHTNTPPLQMRLRSVVDPTGQTGACAFIARGAPSKDRGTETERRTQKQAASQRAVSVFPPHAGAWLKHTCRRPTLHTREQSTTKRPPRRRPC